ncbi:hypothetical protein DRO34_01275 [Candidatus Bathyarchaeota archaeon]|nr:MAG: hypothetical protein DRO34_01275 [Candidatus Bathyarchaeota archaeon]
MITRNEMIRLSYFHPKRAFTLIESKPNEEVYEIRVLLKNVQGAVAKVAQVLANAHVDIRTSVLFDAVEHEGKGYWTAFIEVSKASKGVKQLEKELKRLDVVSEVKIEKPAPVLYDAMHFPILHGNSRAIVMPIELFSSLWEEIENILTPSGFEAVFYNAGKKSGKYIAEVLSKKVSAEIETLATMLAQATKAIGWGVIVSRKINPKRCFAKVEMKGCFEAVLKKNANRKACHWTRGFFAGYMSQLFDKPVEAIETKCIAAGDKVCRFEIKKKI